MRKLLLASAIVLSGLLPSMSEAATACQQHFANGREPRIVNQALLQMARELCSTGHVTLHSGVARGPLYSASYLTRDRVAASSGLPRVNSFRDDTRLPENERSSITDYRGTGYDRGHVAPNGDMADERSQSESFLMSNMMPQVASQNRGIWAAIESATRDMVTREGAAYVVSGPLFVGGTLQRLNGRLLIPTHTFKAVYVPSTGQSGVYIAPNDESGAWEAISLDRLTQMAGFDPFPAVTAGRNTVMDLRRPVLRNR